MSNLTHKTFRALQHRNYRFFFCGQAISLVGTWMQQVAMSWLVYRTTNSAFLLGCVGFTSQGPAALLAPLAGVIADRYPRQKLLLLTQICALVQALLLAILVLTNQITIKHIIGLSLFLGFVNAFDIPIRQSFTVEMIDKKEDLGNAIALNSSIVNLAKLIGPALAGFLIPLIGEGMCFLFNAFSYLAAITAISAMKIRTRPTKNTHSISRELQEGFQYALSFGPIRSILFLLGFMSLAGGSIYTLLPIFAKDIFHAGSQTLGLMMAASGLGALIGAVYLASRQNVLGLSRIMALTGILFGLCIVAFAFSRLLWVSLPLMVVAGFGVMVEMASSNTILQTIVEEDKRGRLMSFFTVAFIGSAPLGSLVAGILAGPLGAPTTMALSGLLCVYASLLFRQHLPQFRSQVNPIYLQKGIWPGRYQNPA